MQQLRAMTRWWWVLLGSALACSTVEPPGPYDVGVASLDAVYSDSAEGDVSPTDVAASDAPNADGMDPDTDTPDTDTPDPDTPDPDTPDTDTPDTELFDIAALDTQLADTPGPDGAVADAAVSDVLPLDSGGDVQTLDAGLADGGPSDSGSADAGSPDTSTVDTSTADTSTADTGTADTGTADTGTADTGTADTGTPDAGTADTGTADTGTPDAGPALAPGLGSSPCKLPGELPQAGAIELVDAFPKLSSTFASLTFLTHPHDGTDRVVVVERKGVVWAFDNSPTVSQKTKVLDISPKVAMVSEGGLLSVAFHPGFGDNGRLFLSYTAYVGGQFSSVFSEIAVDPKTLIAKLPTEKVLLVIKQPFGNHDGGQILFDKSGKLIIGMGDGGSGGDPLNSGQSPSTLLGAVLRIDVDNIPAGKAYGIPADNPKKQGWAPELWAMGLRNPWRMSIDRLTGVLIAGDVGQSKWEEVTLVPKGGNLGWRLMEGNHCYNPSTNCNKTGLVMPIFEYDHSLGYSITGGYVYRGSAHPSLQGMYLFGDYGTKRYWGLWQDGGVWKSKVLLSGASMSPVSFGEDKAGEVYVVTLSGTQKIARIQPKKSAITGPQPPAKLSQTGCFSNLKALTPAPGVVPFSVNTPLWSDGAAKARFVVLPKANVGAGAAKASQGKDDYATMDLPLGTILIKHFELGSAPAGAGKNTPVETRFMVLGKKGWVFWTYTWNAQGTDAELKLDGGETSYPVAGSGKKQVWQQPSTSACVSCHTTAAGVAPLGLTTAQLNGTHTYASGQTLNQLQVWKAEGLLTSLNAAPAAMPAQPWPKLSSLSAKQRDEHARAWMDVNCGTCHHPGGSSQADVDLRFTTPLAGTKACNVTPGFGTNGAGFAKIIFPGSPSASVLYTRIAAQPTSHWFMPHLGVTVPHTDGIALIKAWIQGLSSCK